MDYNRIAKLLIADNNEDRRLGFEILTQGNCDNIGYANRRLFEKNIDIQLFNPKMANLVFQSNNKYIVGIGYKNELGKASYKYIER